MKARVLALLVFLCGFAPGSNAAVAPDRAAVEIAFLIDAVAGSPCEFFRNGRWYDAEKAAAHLREKYEVRKRFGQGGSAEEFIDRIASKSSVSGQAYRLRCPAGAEQDSASWLREALSRYRLASPQSKTARQP